MDTEGFHKENDIYSRMASDRIVIKGKYYFNPTPPLVLNAKVQVRNIITTQLEDITIPHSVFPVLIKSFKTLTLLPGEGFKIPVKEILEGETVEVEPRQEVPNDFIVNHLQTIKEGVVRIENMSGETIN